MSIRTIRGAGEFRYIEGNCQISGTVPGMAVEQVGTEFRPQTTSGAPLEKILVMENSLFGSGISGDYHSGQAMRMMIPQRGSEANVILAVISGSGIVSGGVALSPLSGGTWDLTSRTTGAVTVAIAQAVPDGYYVPVRFV